jgi:hypothetical protein
VEIIVTELASSLRLSSIAFYYSVVLFWEKGSRRGGKEAKNHTYYYDPVQGEDNALE